MYEVWRLFYWQWRTLEKDLWKDGIHIIESGRVIVANNSINYLNNFLRLVNHPI